MEKFLYLVAQDLYNIYGSRLAQHTIVFPNRRAGVFFQKFLSEVTDSIIWSPKIITISELMKELSGYLLGNKISLILKLYQCYKKVLKSSETFDSFYYWGEMLINDFDDIDKYLVNVQELFVNISAEKEIEVVFEHLDENQKTIIEQFLTNIRASRDSKQKQDFITFWQSLFPIYELFSSELTKEGTAYEGKLYRNVAENIYNEEILDFKNFNDFSFVGFNVLNKCEEILFDHLKLENKARFYWDYDNWYAKNLNHEAQFFINPNLQRYPNALNENHFNNFKKGKEIQVISVASKTAQVKVIPEILINKIENLDDTAIILADETLLANLLNSIPEKVKGINITMGFPIKNSRVVSLINRIYQLQKSKQRYNKNNVLFSKELEFFISHYLIKSHALEECESLLQEMQNTRELTTSLDNISKYDQLFSLLQNFNNEEIGFIQLVNRTLKILLQAFIDKNNQTLNIDKELIYYIVKESNKLIDVLKDELSRVNIDVQNRILNQVIVNQNISFIGEPIADLQIMGILESRALDFTNIIMLSVNEGTIPKINAAGSFIPYSLREGFGLQTIKHQDSVYSYYFFRLLQRAENIFLVYNNASDGLSNPEPSRYLQQLKYDQTIDYKEIAYGFEIAFPDKHAIVIQKNEQIIEKLESYFDDNSGKYFSPSALNDYLDCSLRFYFKYIQELRSKDELEDSIQALNFGNILHHTLQEIYEPYLNQELKSGNIDLIIKQTDIESIIKKYYYNELNISLKDVSVSGENDLLLNVIKENVISILKYDKSKAPFTPYALENKFERKLNLNINDVVKSIQVGGKIDRIDDLSGSFDIIDYKTSNPGLDIKSIDEIFDTNLRNRKKEVFQLLFYAYLLQEHKTNTKLCPQLYITRNIKNINHKNEMVIHYMKEPLMEIKNDMLVEFESNLKQTLIELFSVESPFKQTEFEEKCSFCDFRDICNREKKEF